MPQRSRLHHIVVFGATGFTGGLCAEYLARNVAPESTPWAIAGRSRDKLLPLRARLAKIRASCERLPIIVAENSDRASLAAMAKSTRVLVSTVGPFMQGGEALFQACAEQGTDYVDSTGEPEFVRGMRERHAESAQRSGAILVNCCGIDCIPADLGAYFTMQKLAPSGPVELMGALEFRARPSGGTLQTLLGTLQHPLALRRGAPGLVESEGRKVGPGRMKLSHDRELGYLVPLPTADPEVVLHSAAQLSLYGPDFRYGHYLVLRRAHSLAVLGAAVTGAFVAAQTAATRALVGKLVQPGEGPSEEQRKRSWFRMHFRARHAGGTLACEVSGGDPGYDETAKMLGESALCLALDRELLPAKAGIHTPASAFGDVLIARLTRAGLNFRVVEGIPSPTGRGSG